MDELEARLEEAAGARFRLIATDGVFSMDGYIATLDQICDLAEQHDALVMVDDSHAVGFIGPSGRGTPEHCGVIDRVDIITGTLGKALGGASGGYTTGRARDRRAAAPARRGRTSSRTPWRRRSSPPPAGARADRELATTLRDRLRENTGSLPPSMTELGFEILPGEHPIVPIMLGDEPTAAPARREARRAGVYVIGFSYPVVPHGTARIRTQMSAAHTPADLDFAADRFAQARDALA